MEYQGVEKIRLYKAKIKLDRILAVMCTVEDGSITFQDAIQDLLQRWGIAVMKIVSTRNFNGTIEVVFSIDWVWKGNCISNYLYHFRRYQIRRIW